MAGAANNGAEQQAGNAIGSAAEQHVDDTAKQGVGDTIYSGDKVHDGDEQQVVGAATQQQDVAEDINKAAIKVNFALTYRATWQPNTYTASFFSQRGLLACMSHIRCSHELTQAVV